MNTKISEAAVVAAMSATFDDYRADGASFEEYNLGQINLPDLLHRYGAHHAVEEEAMVRAILAAALPHLAADAVPVAWQVEIPDKPFPIKIVRREDVAWEVAQSVYANYGESPDIIPLYPHPQPAELAEQPGVWLSVDGSYEAAMGRRAAWEKMLPAAPGSRIMAPERNGDYQRGYDDEDLRDYALDALDTIYALAATGKQQVGAFPWENLPSYLIDKCEGDTISEEGIQRAVADMAKDARYCQPQQVGEVPSFDPGLEKWLRARDLMPDCHNGLVEMDEVIEALNEHERMLMLPAQVGEVQGDALHDAVGKITGCDGSTHRTRDIANILREFAARQPGAVE
jgi:hypothetical protein